MAYTHIPEISCIYTEKPLNTISSNQLSTSEAHYEYEMILVTSGKADVTIDHKSYKLSAGSLVFISSMEHHYFTVTATPYIRFVVSMSSKLIMSYIKEPELLSIFIQRPKDFYHVLHLNEQTYKKIYPLFRMMESEYHACEIFHTSKCASLLCTTLIDLYRAYPDYFPNRGKSNITSAVVNAQRYVNEHYNHSLTLQEIADANFISRHALSLAFKDIVGITFKEYLILFRIAEAKKLLVSTDLSVAEISNEVGYINVNNFVKIFKEKESITPLQFRKTFSSSNSNEL